MSAILGIKYKLLHHYRSGNSANFKAFVMIFDLGGVYMNPD